MNYAIYPIIKDEAGYLSIDGKLEIEDKGGKAKPLGLWALKSKAIIITQEQFDRLKEGV